MAIVIKIFLTLCNFLAITPWYNFEKETFIRRNTFKYYRIGVMLLMPPIMIYYGTIMMRIPKVAYRLMLASGLFSEFLLVAILVYYSTQKIDHWRCLLNKKRHLNISLEYYKDASSNDIQHWQLVSFYFLLFVYISCELGRVILMARPPLILLLVIPRVVYNHGFMVSAMVASTLASSLKTTSDLLKTMVTTKELSSNERKFVEDLKEIWILYRAILKKAESFNEIFGMFFFVGVFLQMAASVSYFSAAYRMLQREFEKGVFIFVVQALIGQTFALFYAIICCDEAMREGKELLTTCFLRRGNIIVGRPREELSQFIEYLKDYPIVLTAANFFSLTRINLLNYAGIVMTYLIVFAQIHNLAF